MFDPPPAVFGVSADGAYLSSAASLAWDVERSGRAPVLALPPWLPQPQACLDLLGGFTLGPDHRHHPNASAPGGRAPPWAPPASAPASAPASSPASAPASSSALATLVRGRRECEGRWLHCFTESRRRCRAPGEKVLFGPWSDRLGAHRPDMPIGSAPFYRVAEYTVRARPTRPSSPVALPTS